MYLDSTLATQNILYRMTAAFPDFTPFFISHSVQFTTTRLSHTNSKNKGKGQLKSSNRHGDRGREFTVLAYL
jgi:hypothetical protein